MKKLLKVVFGSYQNPNGTLQDRLPKMGSGDLPDDKHREWCGGPADPQGSGAQLQKRVTFSLYHMRNLV